MTGFRNPKTYKKSREVRGRGRISLTKEQKAMYRDAIKNPVFRVLLEDRLMCELPLEAIDDMNAVMHETHSRELPFAELAGRLMEVVMKHADRSAVTPEFGGSLTEPKPVGKFVIRINMMPTHMPEDEHDLHSFRGIFQYFVIGTISPALERAIREAHNGNTRSHRR